MNGDSQSTFKPNVLKCLPSQMNFPKRGPIRIEIYLHLKPYQKIIKHLPSARIKLTQREFIRKNTCNDDDDEDDEINLIISFFLIERNRNSHNFH